MLPDSLKAMTIVAWNGSGQPSAIFNGDVFKKVLSVFITAAILKLGQGKKDHDFTSSCCPHSIILVMIFSSSISVLFCQFEIINRPLI